MFRVNEEKKGIEIIFDSIPAVSVRDELKAAGWRWLRSGGFWYNRNTPENLLFAEKITGGKAEEVKKEKDNKKSFEINKENLKSCINKNWRQDGWSEAATVARACKRFLNLAGIACKVKSNIYSMGDSVTVTCENLPHEKETQLKALLSSAFQDGDFDGMNDIYNYRNNPENLPRTKYFFLENTLSEKFREDAVAFVDNITKNKDLFTYWEKVQKVFRGEYKDWDNVPLIQNYA